MLRGFLFLFFAGTTQAPMGPGHKKQIYNFFFKFNIIYVFSKEIRKELHIHIRNAQI